MCKHQSKLHTAHQMVQKVWLTCCAYIYPVSLSSWVSGFSWKTSVTLQKNIYIKRNSTCLVSALSRHRTFTFGPGGPWIPGCPCIHLQDALPAVRPISAYPPHCHGHKGKTTVWKLHLWLKKKKVKPCWMAADSPHRRVRSSPRNKPSLGHRTSPFVGDPPGGRWEIRTFILDQRRLKCYFTNPNVQTQSDLQPPAWRWLCTLCWWLASAHQ